jgi:hypothetical protein
MIQKPQYVTPSIKGIPLPRLEPRTFETQIYIKSDNGTEDQVLSFSTKENDDSVEVEFVERVKPFSGYRF